MRGSEGEIPREGEKREREESLVVTLCAAIP
jgi:hypothetical protein